ncbi:hypothetical protein HBE96_21225 [Clostridium sp. P21]|uniref:Lipoprotein n=1 Tax=Clostridium muellerianum TaxID=2716538 RepID=A0A7Y0EME3_9CLOT|nr:hypothetical protein [Clostridium muellerianum]NMM65110.1 hypothetical protein [Clostridium muellerianum]
MRKMVIAIIIMFSLTLISCGKITYTKEFEYLPSYKQMTLKTFQKPTKDGMGIATYTIKNKKSKDVLESYEKQLKKDGWKITEDKKPTSITAEKEGHKAVIVPTQNKEDVLLTIVSQ